MARLEMFVKLSVCFVILCSFSVDAATDLKTLRFVNILYRHGDRGPIIIYPNDPNKASSWKQGLGFLTTQGIEQHYNLGKYLRGRYDGYLDSEYKVSQIHFNSSDINRSLMSAYANNAGLYPPKKYQVWNDQLQWQPIPVHTIPTRLDNMLALGVPCPKYDQLYKKSLKAAEILREEKDNKAFYEFVSKESGVSKLESIDKIWAIRDVLFCEKNNNKTWASWVNQTIYEKLDSLQVISFDLLFNGPVESRLKGGPLLKKFIENIQAKIAGKLTQKAMVYSGHDTSIAAVLSAMQVFNQISPPYTSTVFMELHEVKNKYHIQLSYKNDTYPAPVSIHELTIPGCALKCPLDDFIRLTKDRVPDDWHQECQVPISTTKMPDITNTKASTSGHNGHNSGTIRNGVPAMFIAVLAEVLICRWF